MYSNKGSYNSHGTDCDYTNVNREFEQENLKMATWHNRNPLESFVLIELPL